MDGIHIGLGVGFLITLVLWLFEASRRKAGVARAFAAEKELEGIKTAPGVHEYRVESFKVLWYPVVEYDRKSHAIKKITVGVPNCMECGVPLAAGSGEFACGKCGFKAPESVVAVQIMDQIAAKVKGYFELRYPTGL
jgi:ribosomal protein S27AE